MLPNVTPTPALQGTGPKLEETGHLKLDSGTVDAGDGSQFRAALERHMQQTNKTDANPVQGPPRVSLGDQMIGRATTLSAELKNDQTHVSKLLETSTRTGSSMDLMKAMTAMNDYQMRVQFVSKVVSKATSSLDQLTKLQ